MIRVMLEVSLTAKQLLRILRLLLLLCVPLISAFR
jgi:hypothetical protein